MSVLPTGRDLDLLISERVMGDVPGQALIAPYSTDIRAAWDVHLNMLSRLFSVRRAYYAALQELATELCSQGGASEGFTPAWPDVLTVLRHEMPRAICRAALLAVGGTVGGEST